MTEQYPRMLYKAGGDEPCHGLDCETRVVNDEIEHGEAKDEGFMLSPSEAHGGEPLAQPLPDPAEANDEIEAMRDEIVGLKQEIEDERAITKQLDADLTAAKARVAELDKAAVENDELLKMAEADREAALAGAKDSKKSGGAPDQGEKK